MAACNLCIFSSVFQNCKAKPGQRQAPTVLTVLPYWVPTCIIIIYDCYYVCQCFSLESLTSTSTGTKLSSRAPPLSVKFRHPPAPFCFCRTSSPRLFLENVYTTDISCTSFANWYLHCDNRSGAVFFLSDHCPTRKGRSGNFAVSFFGPEGVAVSLDAEQTITSGTTFLSHPFVCFVSSIFIVMQRCSVPPSPPKKKIHVGGASIVVFFFFFRKSLLAARL